VVGAGLREIGLSVEKEIPCKRDTGLSVKCGVLPHRTGISEKAGSEGSERPTGPHISRGRHQSLVH